MATTTTHLHLRFGLVVVNVKDIGAAKRFYTEVLGLKVQREAPNFVQFDTFAVATDSPAAVGTEELYWLVDDAAAAHREIAARGGSCTAVVAKPFGNVFTLKDPDGHERFVLELAAVRPSKAV